MPRAADWSVGYHLVPAEVSGASAVVAFLRDAGLVGVSVLFVLALISRRIVLGWQYDEERERAERERTRADRAEALLDKLTNTADRSTVVTEHVIRRRLPEGEPDPPAPIRRRRSTHSHDEPDEDEEQHPARARSETERAT